MNESRASGGRFGSIASDDASGGGRFATLVDQRGARGGAKYDHDESEPGLVSTDPHDATNETTPEEVAPEDVTRAQDGQFSEETDGVLPVTWERPKGTITEESTELVDAPSVMMDRSGAQTIKGQRITMTNSGAQSIDARSVKLENSGAAKLAAERATLNDSSVLVGSAKDLRLTQSRVAALAVGGSATLAEGNAIGALAVGGELEAAHDVRAVFLAAGSVKAGGSVSSVLNPVSAAALGGGFAVVLAIVTRLFRRRAS